MFRNPAPFLTLAFSALALPWAFADGTSSMDLPHGKSGTMRTIRPEPVPERHWTTTAVGPGPRTDSYAQVLLIETGMGVFNSVGRALLDLGVPFVYYDGPDFSTLDLSPYKTVIVAMDGGSIEDASIANVQAYANAGGNLVMMGGSAYPAFVNSVDLRLLDINTSAYSWTTVAGRPHLSVTNPQHRLSRGLPPSLDFVSVFATYYMIRCQDAAASVAAINGDGYQALLAKPIGAGRLSWFINSPADLYWTSEADYQILKQVVKNALQRSAVALIETASVTDSVERALNELGVDFDAYRTADFDDLDLSHYETVMAALNGGAIEDASVANLQTYVGNGGNLVMLGGTAYAPFAAAVDARLLNIDTSSFGWSTVAGRPHLTVTAANHRLARALPANYTFLDVSATYYMIRSQDVLTQVAARNGDGFDALLSKPFGAGRLTWFINCPAQTFWSQAADYQILKQIIENSVCRSVASWSNYGQGWPGTLGVPSFVSGRDPVVGTTISLILANSKGSSTTGFLFFGLQSADLPTQYGGRLALIPYSIFTIPVSSTGVSLASPIPDIVELIGLPVYLQAVEMDPGASLGASFSAGLELIFGDCEG